MSGINAIIFYVPVLFSSLGSSRSAALLNAIIVGAIHGELMAELSWRCVVCNTIICCRHDWRRQVVFLVLLLALPHAPGAPLVHVQLAAALGCRPNLWADWLVLLLASRPWLASLLHLHLNSAMAA